MRSAIEAVTQLVLQERQSRDRGWWDEMRACYAEDSVVDISWIKGSGANFIEQTIDWSKNGVWGQHRLSPPAVRVNEGRAWAELPIAIEFRIDVDGVEADLVSYARSQYRCQLIDGEWRIVRLETIYERDTFAPSVPGTRLAVCAEDSPTSARHFAVLPGIFTATARRWARTCPATTGPVRPFACTMSYAHGSPLPTR